jgi:signal transduction histidine kinase/CheY-like chemotaxis protein
MVGAMIDISDRKRAEEELREETNTLETINRISQLMAAELDLQKLLQYITDACTELTRAEFGAFFYNVKNENGGEYALYTLSGVPRHAFENFPLPRATELFGPTFRGEETICIDDVKLDPRYGKNPPFYGMPSGHLPVSSYLAVPVISRSGEVIGGLFFGHSKPGVFTERDKKIVVGIAGQSSVAIDNARLFETAQGERDRAKEASRLKDDFIATVSHELRTPLTSMLGWSRMLRTGKLDQATSTRALETIERNAQMQAQLIEDLLDISRIISGKMKLDIQPLEPIQVVESALDSIKPAMEAKNIRLKSVLNPDTGPILADPTRLQQIIWNLLSNAVKFTPKDGRVELQLIRVGSNIKIIVSDTGRGIDPDFLPYVFERFRQADTRSTRREGGLGLGLSIVINLVELHGGTIEAHSEGVGKGATFTVTLPLMAIHKQKTNEKFQSIWSESLFECPPAIKGVRVLILDDEPDTRELLAALLEECKAQVLAVSSAAEALDKIEGFKPDVIVSDIEMPDVNGYEFIRQLRATKDKNHRIPVIALTAYARTEDRMRALSAGFQMHVPKPVEPAELIMVIASLVEQSRK